MRPSTVRRYTCDVTPENNCMRTFGNSPSSIRGILCFAGIFAVIVAAFLFWIAGTHSDLISRLTYSLMVGLGVACIVLVGVLPTYAFSIRVDADSVKHVFLGRFILSHRRLDDLRAVRVASGAWGAVLEFEHQGSIRFLGASLPELRALCVYLSELRPNQISFSSGLLAAGLMELEDRIRNR